MVERGTWLVNGFEKALAANKERLSWMAEEYKASEGEIEVEAIGQTLVAFTYDLELISKGLGDGIYSQRAEDLRKIQEALEKVSARASISQKHLSTSRRRQNVTFE